jgi:transcriptional regulator with XRE-family HTH domain
MGFIKGITLKNVLERIGEGIYEYSEFEGNLVHPEISFEKDIRDALDTDLGINLNDIQFSTIYDFALAECQKKQKSSILFFLIDLCEVINSVKGKP